jgi:hypothetical protein
MSLFIGVSPVREPNQKYGHWYPSELVPVEERKTDEYGIAQIIERDREQADVRYQQQAKAMLDHAIAPFNALNIGK